MDDATPLCQVDAARSTFTLLQCPRCGSGQVACYPPEEDPTGIHPELSAHQHECEDCGHAEWFDGEDDWDDES